MLMMELIFIYSFSFELMSGWDLLIFAKIRVMSLLITIEGDTQDSPFLI